MKGFARREVLIESLPKEMSKGKKVNKRRKKTARKKGKFVEVY